VTSVAGQAREGKGTLLAESTEVVISYRVGLHARPATLFAKMASAFSSTISIENLTKRTKPVNAKSPLNILAADIRRDDRLRITADGADEKAAVEALSHLITTNFGEVE
jgi:phosphotransferase system HPr (HPr) family protein